jgi:hypothetical protein
LAQGNDPSQSLYFRSPRAGQWRLFGAWVAISSTLFFPKTGRQKSIKYGLWLESCLKTFIGSSQTGAGKAYEKAGACNVRETGRISQTLQRAVKVGTNQKRTVVFMADDLHGFYRLDPDVSKWVCSAGRRISLPDMANTLLTEMRLVGALAHPWVGSTQKAMRWNNSNGLPRPTAIIAAWISLLSTHH